MLNPTAPARPEITSDTLSEAPSAEFDGNEAGIAEGASSHVVDLWIDLVSQASNVESTGPLPSVTGLGRQQFKALIYLRGEALTMADLARRLGICSAAATLVAEGLISAGAAERYRDTLDRRVVRLVATVVGVQMASDYRATQVATLDMLLGKLEPARRAVLAQAMQEVAKAMDWTSTTSVENMLIPDPERWTLN